MAKAPQPGSARKAAGDVRDGDEGFKFRVTLDGERFEMIPTRVSPADALALRKAIGIGPWALVRRVVGEGVEIDTAAAMAWLSRRQNGEPDLSFDEVAGSYTLGSMMAPEATTEAEPHSPE